MEISAFEQVKIARDANRPHTTDIIRNMFTDFVEIHGDRRYADDAALVGGFARLDGIEVAVIGHQKGRGVKQRRARNFGMAKPEGYRKALRIMKLAEKFSRPIMTIVDTTGAYPGIDAEERGQAEAIANNLREMASFDVPIITLILGEGGSGGALAIAVSDRILMMENAVYSVISPEGCAAILWKDAGQSERAANSLKLTSSALKANGIVDEIIEEKENWEISADADEVNTLPNDEILVALKASLLRNLRELNEIDVETRKRQRVMKYRNMGEWIDDGEDRGK